MKYSPAQIEKAIDKNDLVLLLDVVLKSPGDLIHFMTEKVVELRGELSKVRREKKELEQQVQSKDELNKLLRDQVTLLNEKVLMLESRAVSSEGSRHVDLT